MDNWVVETPGKLVVPTFRRLPDNHMDLVSLTELAATLRIASARSHVSQSEIRNSIIPGGGGTQRLPRLIGNGRAADLILTGRAIGATDAHHRGLLNTVLPVEGFSARSSPPVSSPVADTGVTPPRRPRGPRAHWQTMNEQGKSTL